MSNSLNQAPFIRMIFDRLVERGSRPLLYSSQGEISAAAVLENSEKLTTRLTENGIGRGSICGFVGDYSPNTVGVFLALARVGAMAVPLTKGVLSEREELARLASIEWWIHPENGQIERAPTESKTKHPLIKKLSDEEHPGLIVFTSGSTGKPKAILHDIDRVASKFEAKRPSWRMLLFLLMDHFGGFNTLLSVLANDSVGVCVDDRTPLSVCKAIEAGRADLLPTTPTFLGMLIASGLWKSHDLSSIRLVTYGAEPMPPTTLSRMREILPKADFKQTYGLSEIGVLRSSSPDPGSLWLKVGGNGFETKIVDDQLYIRSSSAMIGYLNAETPIDADGWLNTGDLVEERDGLVRFLGRRSEVINVGGQKVLPVEVEDILLEAEGVTGAVVRGIPHPLLGQAVVAKVALQDHEESKSLTERLRAHCRLRLQKYKIPIRFEIVEHGSLTTTRAKRNRQEAEG